MPDVTADAGAPRIVLYVRVSTEEQATRGYGLDAQQTLLERAADYEGWDVVELIRDEGQSAGTLDRPGLQRALKMLARGDADGIAVAKLDRLTRSTIDFAQLLDWLKDAKARLIALDMRLDTSTAMGRMAASLVVLIAEWERGTIAERTVAGLAAKRAKGQATGRPSVADRPELAERIRQMREIDGLSLQAIADKLTAEGVPTARGAPRWRASSVQTAVGWQRRPPRRRSPALPKLNPRRGR